MTVPAVLIPAPFPGADERAIGSVKRRTGPTTYAES